MKKFKFFQMSFALFGPFSKTMSLASQLANIANASASTVLDRKKRQKLHLASLVYDAKTAATQDYDSILGHSQAALEALEQINPKFARFSGLLFADSAVSIDRNVQTADQVAALDLAIELFFNMVAPYWNNPASYNAAEWLVRRFSAHIHNSEALLLLLLPYHQSPLFAKTVAIIPQLPPLFAWLQGVKNTGRQCTRESVVRAFSDLEFLQTYCIYLRLLVGHGLAYHAQLVFFVGCTALAVALQASLEKFLEPSGEALLRVFAALASAHKSEAHVAAQAIAVLLAAAAPLLASVVDAMVEALAKTTPYASALTALTKVYLVLPGVPSAMPIANARLVARVVRKDTDSSMSGLVQTSSKLLASLVASLAEAGTPELCEGVYSLLDAASLSESAKTLIILSAIKGARDAAVEDKSQLVGLFEYLVKHDKLLVNRVLESESMLASDLEMCLQSVVSGFKATEEPRPAQQAPPPPGEAQLVREALQKVVSPKDSFFVSDSGLRDLVLLFISSCRLGLQSEFGQVFEEQEPLITFYLRVGLSQTVPAAARIYAFESAINTLKVVKNTYLGLLLPIVLALSADELSAARKASLQLLTILRENGAECASSSEKSEKIFMQESLYGSKALVLLPEDLGALLNVVLENAASIELDRSQIFNIIQRNIFMSLLTKKTRDNVLAYVVVSSQHVQHPFVQMVLFRLARAGARTVKRSQPTSVIYGEFLGSYLHKRTFFERLCVESGCSFTDYERVVLALLDLDERVNRSSEAKKSGVVSSLTFLQKALSLEYQSLVDLALEALVANFEGLRVDYQTALAQSIVENLDGSLYDAGALLQALPLSAAVFEKLFGHFRLYATTEAEHLPKRRRRSLASTRQAMRRTEVARLAEGHLRNVTLLLETYEAKGPQLVPTSQLLASLFNLLLDLETLGLDGNLPVVYAQELLAGCLLSALKNSKGVELDATAVRADVVVSVIRLASAPLLQNKLLLVVAELGSREPELVLHAIMPIFTFMGAHTVRQDDEYLTHVIEQTVAKVVPALALAGGSEETNFLLASFLNTLNHIPRHRRVRLFTTLVKILGPGSLLHVVLFIVGRQHARAALKHKTGECRLLAEFARAVMKPFPVDAQIDALRSYLGLWEQIPLAPLAPDGEEYKAVVSEPVLGPEVAQMLEPELGLLRKSMISFLDRVVGEAEHSVPHLRLQVGASLLDPRSQGADTLLALFRALVADLLLKLGVSWLGDIGARIERKFHRLLEDVLSLLPVAFFADAAIELVRTPTVCASACALAGRQFEAEAPSDASNAAADRFVAVLVSEVVPRGGEDAQAALDAAAVIIERFDISETHVRSLMSLISDVQNGVSMLSDAQHPEIVVAALAAASSCVTVLGLKSVGFLAKTMGASMQVFDAEFSDDESRGLVQTAVAALYATYAKKMLLMLQPYLQRVLVQLLNLNSIKKEVTMVVLDQIYVHINIATLFSALLSVWGREDFERTLLLTVGMYLNMLTQTVQNLDKGAASGAVGAFSGFFVSGFEFVAGGSFPKNAMARVEALLLECELQYILRLNDRSFRPLFGACVRWAFEDNPFSLEADFTRVGVFLRFFCKLQDSLKGVVTSYFLYVLEYVLALLSKFVDHVGGSCQRLVYVCISNAIKYDQDEYWTVSTRFEKMATALTDQLAVVDGKLGKHLTRALSALAAKNSKVAEHNKRLCKLLTAHLGSECLDNEKYAAVKALESVYVKVGASWLGLLPQLVPFIAELLEDDNERVEMEVRRGLVRVIEDVLGESLDKYLT